MKVNILTLIDTDIPAALLVAEPRPKQLYWTGGPPADTLSKPRVAIVGSRKATAYGRTVAERLAGELARAGVTIISGLAYGIDSYAHAATLKADGQTVAVLPSPLQRIYPAAHYQLAEEILRRGGALVSEYPAGTAVRDYHFIARNRLISALADAVVIPEAALKSGSLHTARFALEQGKTVMAVPGSINSPTSEGCNNLIKSGALPVTSVNDILFALGINPQSAKTNRTFRGTPRQRQLFELIAGGTSDQEALAAASRLSAPETSSTLTMLELQGYIRPAGGGHWTVS